MKNFQRWIKSIGSVSWLDAAVLLTLIIIAIELYCETRK